MERHICPGKVWKTTVTLLYAPCNIIIKHRAV